MLLTHLLNVMNKLHKLIDAYSENPVLPDDMNLFVAFQLVNKLGHGQCHALTLALHDFNGMPIYLLVTIMVSQCIATLSTKIIALTVTCYRMNTSPFHYMNQLGLRMAALVPTPAPLRVTSSESISRT